MLQASLSPLLSFLAKNLAVYRCARFAFDSGGDETAGLTFLPERCQLGNVGTSPENLNGAICQSPLSFLAGYVLFNVDSKRNRSASI